GAGGYFEHQQSTSGENAGAHVEAGRRYRSMARRCRRHHKEIMLLADAGKLLGIVSAISTSHCGCCLDSPAKATEGSKRRRAGTLIAGSGKAPPEPGRSHPQWLDGRLIAKF